MDASTAQVVDGIAPKADEFLLRRALVAPPRPALGVLMEGAEDDGNGLSLVVFQPADEANELVEPAVELLLRGASGDRKSTRLNSSHANISYAVFCLKKTSTVLTHLLELL